jgi:uncharacterized DUF497 family protein
VKIEFDPRKDQINRVTRGISLAQVRVLEWDTAIYWLDVRRDYGELRYVALGYIGLRLHCVVYTDRGDKRCIISLRRANSREVRLYAKT